MIKMKIRSAISNSLNKLVSRNFDINGYWGVGMLIRDMKNNQLTSATYRISDSNNKLKYNELITKLVVDQLTKAKIDWIAYDSDTKIDLRVKLVNGHDILESGSDFLFSMHIFTNGNNNFIYTRLIHAWPHDTNKEFRSGRS